MFTYLNIIGDMLVEKERGFVEMKVAILVGSLRKAAYSKLLANNLAEMLPKDVEPVFVDISKLPFYNQDFDDEGEIPKEVQDFREEMKDMDAVLFVTPEYNRSVPGVLKNAIDVGSRPKASSVWAGLPAAVVSQSPGNLSGFGANHHLRQSLVSLNMPTLQQPEAYIANTAALFDDDGKIANEGTAAFLQTFVDEFVAWIKRHQ